MSQLDRIGTVYTRVFTVNDSTYVRYHDTYVVIFNEDGITLDTDGWFTKTTKLRMNQAAHVFDLGISVYQKNCSMGIP